MNLHKERFWYRLFCTRGIGPKKMMQIFDILVQSKIDVEELFKSWEKGQIADITAVLGKKLTGLMEQADGTGFAAEFDTLLEKGIKIIYPDSPYLPDEYLLFVRQFGISPLLFAYGNTALTGTPGVAIVGSRDASEPGVKIAGQLAGHLASSGFNVVSGYAKGVDEAAHQGALQAGGTTTMVLSYGILHFSLKQALRAGRPERDILAVSQYLPADRWRARNAMKRNILVGALSQTLIVVASGPERNRNGGRSGTFHAGMHALKMGRPLFVISPSLFPSKTEVPGNAALIRAGGIEITPENAVDHISAAVAFDESGKRGIRKFRQRDLFD